MGFLKERGRSFKYAFAGIKNAVCTQRNARIHLVAAIVAVTCGIILEISVIEWMFVVVAIGFVITAEIINTAIEKLVDLVSPERQEKAGIVKDLSAGAVLIASLMAFLIGSIIFIPKILQFFVTSNV